jgi:hypothetical protein
MFGYPRINKTLALIGACLVLGLWSERVSAQINCNTGGSIQAALNSGQTFVEFTGTCNESVFVVADGTVIGGASGNRTLDVVNGGINVSGAQRVAIMNLTVNGDGFFISGGSAVNVINTIVANTKWGFGVFRNSQAVLQNNIFGPALIDDGAVSCLPICVGENSYARLQNNTVNGASDSWFALDVYRHSSIRIRGGNTISNTGTGGALSANQGSYIRQDDAGGNGTDQIVGKVDVFIDSVLGTRQAVITGEVSVRLHSILRTGSSSGGDPSLMVINGGIALSEDSALAVLSPLVTINGDVTCADSESSATGSFAGTGNNLCSGFSSVHSDFNGDGKADVLWRSETTGTTIIWLMDGTTRLAAGAIGNPPLAWQIDKIEDYNGDGKGDILWRHTGNGKALVWLMDGFTKLGTGAIGSANADWQIQP